MSPRAPWAVGSARFAIERRVDQATLATAVECRFQTAHAKHVALLDTGAPWSLIGGDLASQLRPSEPSGVEMTMTTRLGRYTGTLERVSVHLLAEPGSGADMIVDATVLLAPEWRGPVVLGMRGLLERIRLELAPDDTGEDCWWSFGATR